MRLPISILIGLLGLLHCPQYVVCDDGGDDAVADDGAADDGGGGDDVVAVDDAVAVEDDAGDAVYDEDYIKYWTEYALLPKRCIVYNDVDVIVYSVFEHGYKQCSDEPMGTYLTPVPTFVSAYLDQMYTNEMDKGNDDYVTPDNSQYVQCTRVVIANQEYYVQLGCTDGTSQSISVNIYDDNTCETRSEVEGLDDSNIDVSDIQLPFKQCQACVVWVDKNDDEIDDMFYENRQIEAPLCSSVWQYKSTCDRQCQKMGIEKVPRDGWNTSDKVLLIVLSLFGLTMLIAILQKRNLMSNKDALLEQAAISAAGLQQTHVIAIFVLALVVIVIFAMLGMKNITWAMLLIMNTILFAYLMKLTVDSSVGQTVVGPDGKIIRVDSEESSVASEHLENTMQPPEVPPLATQQNAQII